MDESENRPEVRRGWPLEAFVGDVIVCTLEGSHLDQVTEIRVSPAGKGIRVSFGDPLGQSKEPVQSGPDQLTVTFEIDATTYPGEKRIELMSAAGPSDPLPFLVML
ncbi:MAG: hypothetical protein Q6M04_04325 [Thermostichus sp. BF3_bins_97]